MPRVTLSALILALFLSLPDAPVSAQSAQLAPQAPAPAPRSSGASLAGPGQVLSANPFGLLIDFFNSEYEIRGSDSVTFGAGASTRHTRTYDYDYTTNRSSDHRERYVNGDLFVRYYPGGQAFSGTSLGVKAGITRLPSQGSFFGVGFDWNQSRMLNQHTYLGFGFGLKRLIGTSDRAFFDLKYIPTLRMNIGIGF